MTDLPKFLIFLIGLALFPIDATAQWTCIADKKYKEKLVLQNQCGADMLVSFCIKETTRPFLSDTNCHLVKKDGAIKYEFWITQPDIHDYGYRYTYITPARSGEVERCPPRPDCSDLLSSELDADRDSGNSHESDYASALGDVLETNDYQDALGDLDKKAAQRRQRLEQERQRQVAAARRLEEERKRQSSQDRTNTETAGSSTPDNQEVCVRILEAWGSEVQAVNESDACDMARSIVRVETRVLNNLAANNCPAKYQEDLNNEIDYWQSLAENLCF